MADEILPPTNDEVKFHAMPLKLTPLAFSKVDQRQKASGLNRAKLLSALLNAGHAALDGDIPTVQQWQEYYAKVVAANAAKTK